MLSTAFFVIITTLAIVVIALIVLAVLMTTRRPMASWQDELKGARTYLKPQQKPDEKRGAAPQKPILVEPQTESIFTVMERDSTSGSGYLSADELQAPQLGEEEDD
ncbi:hypothetical protein QS713_07655 [Gleimia hominis]|uniref:EF-hand domain-containing protein n=1 Tax=Gleimia hominis TaxID=595468 RepID=A0ABU3IC39_9ACTO|nr:hypothetical protein [Gleimia hominis]MDT3767933.1 hypothetical protein [Gleimia hominis]